MSGFLYSKIQTLKKDLNSWNDIFFTSSTRFFSLFSNVLILFITARYLGPSGRGEVALLLTWLSFFTTLFFLSLGQVSANRITQKKEDFGKVFGDAFVLSAISSFVGIVIALLAVLIFYDQIFNKINSLYFYIILIV